MWMKAACTYAMPTSDIQSAKKQNTDITAILKRPVKRHTAYHPGYGFLPKTPSLHGALKKQGLPSSAGLKPSP